MTTNDTGKAMTLEQVMDKLRNTAKFERDAHMQSNAKAWDEMADAIDTHLKECHCGKTEES